MGYSLTWLNHASLFFEHCFYKFIVLHVQVLHSNEQCPRIPTWPYPFARAAYILLFNVCQANKCKVKSHCLFCHFSDNQRIWTFLHRLIGLFGFLAHFSIEIYRFLFLMWKWLLPIPPISTLLVIHCKYHLPAFHMSVTFIHNYATIYFCLF